MTREYNSKITGERIAKLRKDKGLTQERLANKFNVETSLIGHYERGRKIPIEMLYKIAKYFGTSTDYLLGLTESKSSKISDVAICSRTGLENKQTKILEILKNREIIDTINFLIEQEEDVLLGDIPPIEATHFNKIQYEKAEQDYYKELKRIEKNCNPILRTIHNYFSIKGTDEDMFVMPDGSLKKLSDFKYRTSRFLANETISTKEVIENVLLEKIKNQLKNAKSNIEKGEPKK